jgi:hypothetical protein
MVDERALTKSYFWSKAGGVISVICIIKRGGGVVLTASLATKWVQENES